MSAHTLDLKYAQLYTEWKIQFNKGAEDLFTIKK